MDCNRWSRHRPALPDNQLYSDEALYIAEIQRFIRRIPAADGGVRLIAIDGIYGPETRQAVAEFQRDYGLPPTGRVDRATWELLFDEYERSLDVQPPQPLSAGSSGVEVLVLQSMINQIAERYANITTVPWSGDYDDATEAAVEALQRIVRLPATGEADRASWLAISQLMQ